MINNRRKISVWLDLEETVIKSWHEPYYTMHVHKLRQWIWDLNPVDINIWSFAIWNEEDKKHFIESGIKQDLEGYFKKSIDKFYSIKELMQLCKPSESPYSYDSDHQWVQFNGKLWSFIKFAMLQEDTEFYLIDDCVPHTIIEFPDRNIKITTLNIVTDL